MRHSGASCLGAAMSIRAEAVKRAIRALGIREKFDRPVEEILADAMSANEENAFRVPADEKRVYRRVDVDGCPILVAQAHETPAKKAILYLCGGGFTRYPNKMQLDFTLGLGDRTDSDVWVPWYPLCIGQSVLAAYDMCLDTYAKMLETYEADQVSILGSSAGGNLAIGICQYNTELGRRLPMPRQLIPISPGSMPVTPEELARVEELAEKDLLIPASFALTLPVQMRHDDERVRDYMVSNQLGDFSGLPPMHLVFGSDEVLLAVAPSLVRACEEAGVEHTLTIGEGMWHCYPTYPLCPESEECRDLIASWLK